MHIAVLMGGPSSEHDVSVKSGTAVADALESAGLQVTRCVFDQPLLPEIPTDIDAVFPALHGAFGEDGELQGLLEAAGIAYVGCDAVASRMIMDKQVTKDTLSDAGLAVPSGLCIRDPKAPIPDGLQLPVIVKPNREGSTIGLTVVESIDQWTDALAAGFAKDDAVLVEEIVCGTEITVGLLDGKALPVVEIVPPEGLFDYDAKYTYSRGKTEYFCPPRSLSMEIQDVAREMAETAYTALGARDMLRVDMIIDSRDGQPRILEGNSLPGFTATSLLPKAAAAAGIPFDQLCVRLVQTAAGRGGAPADG